MNTFHIIIRPRVENFKEEWFEMLILEFNNPKYLVSIGLEDGVGNEKPNHIDMSVTMKGRQDNVRRKIKNIIKFVGEDDDEELRWLCVKKHDREMYSHGYSLKESQFGVDFELEIKEKDIKDLDRKRFYSNRRDWKKCIIFYLKNKIEINILKCGSINKLLDVVLNYYENNIIKFDEIPMLRSLCVKMCNEGLLHFSLARKINIRDEIFWQDKVRNLEIHEIEYEISKNDPSI